MTNDTEVFGAQNEWLPLKDETKEERQMGRKKRTRNQVNKNEDRKEKPGKLRTHPASGTKRVVRKVTFGWLKDLKKRKGTGARPGTGTS